jgi:dihydrofolate reductase
MGKVIAFLSVSLDGVMQAPARPDEDTRDGFKWGGWAARYADEVTNSLAGSDGSGTGAILLGRRSYEDLHQIWVDATDNPFTAIFNSTPKYVVSQTLQEPLAWQNSIQLTGDAVESVGKLRRELDQYFVIIGSGELVRSILPHGLVDRFVLSIAPVVLGSGMRLFEPGTAYADLRLTDTKISTTGVVIATYDVVEAAPA